MIEAKWSPEPWIRGEEHELKIEIQQARPPYHHVATAHASYVSDRRRPPDGRTLDANARRIVACVNACQGIPTEALESGALGKALDLAVQVVNTGTPIDHIPGSLEAGVALVRALRALGRLK